MTDATAGRGGVGIRLYTTGGELVKRNFNEIGDSGKRMWADIATGNRAANPAVRALSSLSADAKGKVGDLAGEAGFAGRALSQFGTMGVLAAAALGGLAIALVKVREGMQFAADLTDAADRIGVGAEALQSWNYVADEAGVKTDQFQANLEKLNGVVGAFRLGIGDAKLKPVFEELGITKDQLANVQTADQMMLLLADTLGQVRDRATQVKLARSMGVEESLPILRMGSDSIRRLMQDGVDLGLVMSDDVRKGFDDADRALEVAQQRIDMSLRVSLVGLAEDFAMVVGAIAEVINWLQKLDGIKISMDLPGRSLPALVSDTVRGRTGAQGDAARDDGIRRQPGWMTWLGFNADRKAELEAEDGAALRSGLETLAGPRVDSGGFDPQGHTGRGGGSSAKNAEREAEQRRQREERAADQLTRAQAEIDRSYGKGAMSFDDKAAYEIADLEVARADRLREIARAEEDYIRSNGLRGLTEVEAAQMRLKQDELTEQQKSVVEWERRRAIEAHRLATEETAAEAAVSLMEIDGQLATSSRERARIEREILIATIEIERRRKKQALEDDFNLTQEQRDRAMQDFDAVGRGRVSVLDHSEDERLRSQFKSYGREIVGAIQDGRIGEYIGDQLKARLLDGALDAMFNMMSGGGKSDGGGWLNAAAKFGMSLFKPGGAKASGGGTETGFVYGAAEHGPELFMLGGNGHVTSAAETAKMVQGLAKGGSGGLGTGSQMIIEQHFHNDFKGAVTTQDLLDDMNARATRAGADAYAKAVRTAKRGAPAVQQGIRRLGTP